MFAKLMLAHLLGVGRRILVLFLLAETFLFVAFFFNNLVLVTIALAIWFLSWLPSHSHAYIGHKKTFEAKDFNLVITPLFIILLFLTAVGPGLGWVKSSWQGLKKNFRGRFGMYMPPLMEELGLVELEHNKRNNRMRAI